MLSLPLDAFPFYDFKFFEFQSQVGSLISIVILENNEEKWENFTKVKGEKE